MRTARHLRQSITGSTVDQDSEEQKVLAFVPAYVKLAVPMSLCRAAVSVSVNLQYLLSTETRGI